MLPTFVGGWAIAPGAAMLELVIGAALPNRMLADPPSQFPRSRNQLQHRRQPVDEVLTCRPRECLAFHLVGKGCDGHNKGRKPVVE